MIKKILFDNKEFHFSNENFPILIHGEENFGASLFTISVLAGFYSQGLKTIALTGFPMARGEFVKQTESDENAQFFTKENKDSFIENFQNCLDINNYVILIKNIELFEENIFNAVKNLNNIIISGDVNKCAFKEKLLHKSFNTKIYFSPLDEVLPELQKYQGHLLGENKEGVISLKM